MKERGREDEKDDERTGEQWQQMLTLVVLAATYQRSFHTFFVFVAAGLAAGTTAVEAGRAFPPSSYAASLLSSLLPSQSTILACRWPPLPSPSGGSPRQSKKGRCAETGKSCVVATLSLFDFLHFLYSFLLRPACPAGGRAFPRLFCSFLLFSSFLLVSPLRSYLTQ